MSESQVRNHKVEIDNSVKISVYLSIELPFWIPIKSGEYKFTANRSTTIRNDLWLVSVVNIVDGPINQPIEHIVNEIQVTDDDYLKRISGNVAKYYHKRKLKTTFTRVLSITPFKGLITATAGSELWHQQLNKVVFSFMDPTSSQMLLDDVNSFIDFYCTMISSRNPSTEIRRVSFYDAMIRILITAETDGKIYANPTKITPDIRMADLPFPRYRVANDDLLELFRKSTQDSEKISFHQLYWIKTLNQQREKRHQEALLSAAITLETLAHLYLKAKGLPKDAIRDSGGMADWILTLGIKELDDDCRNVAELWKLRNSVVHRQKAIENVELLCIQYGIRSLKKLREYFLEIYSPELLDLEKKFSYFLEPIQLGIAAQESVGRLVALEYGWRRECDNYEKVIPPTHQDTVSEPD